MGFSSGKTKQTTDQKTNQTETGTTMPVTPGYLTDAATDYVGRIGAFGDMDPNQFVAPAAPLQNMAWDNASHLGDWQGQAATAATMAQQAGQGGPNLAGVRPMSGSFGANPMGTSAQALLGAPAGTGGQMQRPANRQNAFSGASSLVPGGGYSPAPSQPGYAQARTGAPIGVDRFSGAETAAPASVLDNLGAYQNPYTQQVVDTSLAGFDNQAAQQRAALEAQGARNGAFGGSRFGIAEGQFEGDNTRNRAALEAGLRDQGFNTATGLSAQDAAMRQQASQFNAGAGNQMSQFNAGQQDQALQRQLAAAGLLGTQAQDYGAGTRADLGTMATLGDQQRQIEQAYAMAGPAQLEMMGQLSGMTPFDILVGRQVDGTTNGTMTGTTTTTQKPSLFQMLMQGAGSAARAYSAGQGA